MTSVCCYPSNYFDLLRHASFTLTTPPPRIQLRWPSLVPPPQTRPVSDRLVPPGRPDLQMRDPRATEFYHQARAAPHPKASPSSLESPHYFASLLMPTCLCDELMVKQSLQWIFDSAPCLPLERAYGMVAARFGDESVVCLFLHLVVVILVKWHTSAGVLVLLVGSLNPPAPAMVSVLLFAESLS